MGLLRRLRLERQLSAGEGESLGFSVPRYLYLRLATSNICNYRRKHCHIWMNQEPRNALSTARRVDLLGEFSRLAQRGIVEFPGGEVTLAFEELCTLASASERLGLQAGVVSNGSKLQTPGAARRLVDSGLARIMISLDSHEPRLHDYVRGVPGAFEQATRALRLRARVIGTVACAVDRSSRQSPSSSTKTSRSSAGRAEECSCAAAVARARGLGLRRSARRS